MMTLIELLKQPWTIDTEERHDDGRYFVARVLELPGLVATAENADDLPEALHEALESHLMSYVEAGEMPPLPAGASLFSLEFRDGDSTVVDRGTASDEEVIHREIAIPA